jgi:CBS domain-containing protein
MGDISREWVVSPVLARARARLAQMTGRTAPAQEIDEPRPARARELMTKEVVAVAPETTLRAICELMRQHQIGAVPVIDVIGHVLGLVTDRDVVVRAVAARRDIDRVTAGDIMSVGIECADLDTPIAVLEEKMARYRVRRLPVLDHQEHLVGIVSRDDLH